MLNPYYSARFRDDMTTLDAAWLPTSPTDLLLGFTDGGSGDGLILNLPEASYLRAQLSALVDGRDPSDPPAWYRERLHLHRTNRGEPYRDGIEIEILNTMTASIFLENDDARRLIDLLDIAIEAPEEVEDPEIQASEMEASEEIRARTGELSRNAKPRILGYQIVYPVTGGCWGDRPSFEVLTWATAVKELAEARRKSGDRYELQVICEGDVENPTLC